MYLDQISSYWNQRADGYSDSIRIELDGTKAVEFRELLTKGMSSEGAKKCLDIGCGPGFFTMLLGKMGHHVTAADYSMEMLAYAQRNCEEYGVKADFVREDAQNLTFKDESFDFICSRNLIWNLEEPQKAYRNWMRVLKPGGRLFIYDGNHYLHYYDERYRKAREGRSSNHSSMKGVDPAPINEIARFLPLSREHRPQWDLEILEEMGMNILETTSFTSPFHDEKTGETKELVHAFWLLAEKQKERLGT